MNIDFKVGPHLKAIREAKGLSQAYVCEGICSINSLARIEANTQSPSFDLLYALCNRIGISLNYLVATANYERHSFYYTLKDTMKLLFSTTQWLRLQELLTLVTDDIYNELPIVEQQFIDITRAHMATVIQQDFDYARNLAKMSLAKTFNGKKDEFYSPEEMQLFNIIFRLERTQEHLNLVLKALTWIEAQPESLKDYHAWMLLITGLMSYHYDRKEWQEALQYAINGYNIAVKHGPFNLLINFLFIRGVCLCQTTIDINKGTTDVRTALQLCLQFDMTDLHNILAQDMRQHGLELKENGI